MDTISRENNSMLPVGGVIVGAVALALSLWSLAALSTVKKQVAEVQEKTAKIDDIAAQVSAASSKADGLNARIDGLQKSTQDAFNTVGGSIGAMQAQLAKIEEASKKPAAAKGGKGAKGEPVVAGPGEYVVKSGDSLAKIARANGVSLSDLQSVNPGVDSKHLKVGQKIKLPEKK